MRLLASRVDQKCPLWVESGQCHYMAKLGADSANLCAKSVAAYSYVITEKSKTWHGCLCHLIGKLTPVQASRLAAIEPLNTYD